MVILLAGALFTGCRRQPRPAEIQWPAMGTFATVSVPESDRKHLQATADITRNIFETIEAQVSTFRTNSEFAQLNREAGQEPVPVSTATRDILVLALAAGDLSGGGFDITAGPLVRFWGFNGGTVPETLPSDSALQSVRALVGYHDLQVEGNKARLARSGMRVDGGGIAKGYAVDVAYQQAATSGIAHVMINLGGNLRCRGYGRANQPWRIGVRNPFDRSRTIGTLELTGGKAVATSGNYERFVKIDGRRYAHIVDPRSGYPVQGMAGVTVIANSAALADVMSTTLFVAGLEGSPEILRRVPGCEAILIPDREPMEIYVTSGIKAHFTPEPRYADNIKPLK